MVTPDDYDQLPALFKYMWTCMKVFNGVGIAAPQVGVFKQYCLIERMDGTVMELVNPDITRMYGREIEDFEACLSLPPGGNGCLVPRQEYIKVQYATRHSRYSQSVTLSGRDARVAQHEIDHMTGTFFIDRASKVGRRNVLDAFENYKKARNQRAEDHSRPLSACPA